LRYCAGAVAAVIGLAELSEKDLWSHPPTGWEVQAGRRSSLNLPPASSYPGGHDDGWRARRALPHTLSSRWSAAFPMTEPSGGTGMMSVNIGAFVGQLLGAAPLVPIRSGFNPTMAVIMLNRRPRRPLDAPAHAPRRRLTAIRRLQSESRRILSPAPRAPCPWRSTSSFIRHGNW
jgi:hypothetical protein